MKSKQIKTIAIGAGKGGVGKSTFTVNLAHVLKKLSLNVGILDADLYGPSLSLMLPPDKLLEVTDAGTIKPAVSKGIKVVSLSHFNQGNEAMIVRAPIANATIKKFVEKVDWGDVDVVLIDLPPGTSDIHLTLMQSIPISFAIAVTTPSMASTLDVKKAIDMFKKLNVELLGVVENMSYLEDSVTKERYTPFGQGGGKELSDECKINFLGQIPIEEEVSKSLDKGISIFESAKITNAMRVFEEIGIEIRSKICDDVAVKKRFDVIDRIDKKSFKVVLDGQCRNYQFYEVQSICPCARCKDEVSGKSIVDPEQIDVDVTAFEIKPIGNYALKFQFSSGCSQGIYAWEYLERLCSPSPQLS